MRGREWAGANGRVWEGGGVKAEVNDVGKTFVKAAAEQRRLTKLRKAEKVQRSFSFIARAMLIDSSWLRERERERETQK